MFRCVSPLLPRPSPVPSRHVNSNDDSYFTRSDVLGDPINLVELECDECLDEYAGDAHVSVPSAVHFTRCNSLTESPNFRCGSPFEVYSPLLTNLVDQQLRFQPSPSRFAASPTISPSPCNFNSLTINNKHITDNETSMKTDEDAFDSQDSTNLSSSPEELWNVSLLAPESMSALDVPPLNTGIPLSMDGTARDALMAWVVQIGNLLHCRAETMAHTINYLDRLIEILSTSDGRALSMDQMELYAIACIYVGCKMNEVEIPSIQVLVTASPDLTVSMLLQLEKDVCRLLSWELSVVTPYTVLETAVATAGLPENVVIAVLGQAKGFIQLCLCDHRAIIYRPALIAAAALLSSMEYLNLTVSGVVSPLCSAFGVTLEELDDCRALLLSLFSRSQKHEEILGCDSDGMSDDVY